MIIKDSKLYGYKFVKEKRTLEILEEEAKIIRMIFNYFTDHKSPFFGRVNGIALHLTQMGVKQKRRQSMAQAGCSANINELFL